MKLFNTIQYGNILISDIFNKRFKIEVSPENIRKKVLSSNTNLSEISREEWNNKNIWWFPLLLNRELNPFTLNISDNKIFAHIKNMISSNPIYFFSDEIKKIALKLKYIMNEYMEANIQHDFIIFNEIQIMGKIIEIFNNIPKQDDIEISLYDFHNNRRFYRDYMKNYMIDNNYFYIFNSIITSNITHSYYNKIIFEKNSNFFFKTEYDKSIKNIRHDTNYSVISEIKNAYTSNNFYNFGDFTLFTEKEMKFTFENINLVIEKQNINYLKRVLSAMLKIIILWCKNEI